MIRLRKSPVGLVVAGAFLAAALALFALHFASIKTNPVDSGESAFWFFLPTPPWAYLLPEAVIDGPWWDRIAYGASRLLVAVNAFFIYCLAGGLARGRGRRPAS